MNSRFMAALVAVALGITGFSNARADDGEFASLREELERTKALVQQLESRLAALERAAARAEPALATPIQAAASVSPSAFNPAISAVLEGSFNAYSQNPDDDVILGFALGEEAGPDREGFSLGESELNLAANIDPLFYGFLTAALEDDDGDTEIALEEAYIETLSLPAGFKVKAGRMFPVFGYFNEIHAHADAFVDRPLPYRAFLGGDNYRDDGLQLSVLLPTGFFAEVGGGAYRGIGFPAAGSSSDGTGAITTFARAGGDMGISQSWFAGLSFLRGEADDRESSDLLFNGTTRLYAAHMKYTWSPQGNRANEALTLQGEYLWRNEDGDYDGAPYDEDAEGWYAQAVYKFGPRWTIGYRYSRMDAPPVPADLVGTVLDSAGHDPDGSSLVLEWTNSEFSRLRFQYNRDGAGPNDEDSAVLRYTVSVGAHGAHKY